MMEIDKEYFELSRQFSNKIYYYLENLSADKKLIDFIKEVKGLEDLDDLNYSDSLNPRLTSLLMCDLADVYKSSYQGDKFDGKSLLPMAFVLWKILGNLEEWSHDDLSLIYNKFIDGVISNIGVFIRMAEPFRVENNGCLFSYILERYDKDRVQRYNDLLHEFANIVFKKKPVGKYNNLLEHIRLI